MTRDELNHLIKRVEKDIHMSDGLRFQPGLSVSVELLRIKYWFENIRDNGIEETKKYRIRLEGFNSDNGQQYLTAGRSGENRLFACVLKPGLKQEFTSDEINEIINQLDFKGTWRTDMVRTGLEPVED